MLLKKLFLSLFLLPIVLNVQAQTLPGSRIDADSVSTAFIPVLGYSSSVGLLAGGVFSRFDYRGNPSPFNNLKKIQGIISTKGFFNVEMSYEKTQAFGKDIRLTLEAFGTRFAEDTFFANGNNSTYRQQLWDNEFYFFESYAFGFEGNLRKPIYKKGRGQFDLLAGLGFEYQIGYVNQENSSFNQLMPNGRNGGFVNYLTTGFVWENRDSEFDPHIGNRAQLEVNYAPKYLSEFPLTTVRLDMRQYARLFNFFTLAGRVEGRHAGGNVPYWELSSLGDDYSLRGYPLNRFKGNSSLAYNLELRAWLIQFPAYRIKIGGHVFTDGGRVFTGQDDFEDFFNNHKHTLGVGGAFSAFSPDFILRAEVGFSDNATQLYIGLGYMF